MSDTVVNDPHTPAAPVDPTGFFLDGGAPRLGDASATVFAPPPPAASTYDPQLQTDVAPGAPSLPEVSASMPARVAAPADASAVADPDAEPEHPMAHLMPAKSKPTEASRRAAEKRAIQKAKSKKIKIGVIAGLLVLTAAAGPPLGKWLVNAINEAGDTSVEEPAE